MSDAVRDWLIACTPIGLMVLAIVALIIWGPR